MTETTTSPASTFRTPSCATSALPAPRPSIKSPRSASYKHHHPAMPPFFEPRLSTPHQPVATPKTPSPNYFGFQSGDASFPSEGSLHAKQNWSPPSSAVRSTAALSPTVMPLDQNPEFEAFRRQSESKAFNLKGFGNFKPNAPSVRPPPHGRPGSRTSPAKDHPRPATEPRNVPQRSLSKPDCLDPSIAEMSQSPKRMLSPGSLHLPEAARRGSPASFVANEAGQRNKRDRSAERTPRFELPLDNAPGGYSLPKHRAETLPATNDADSHLMVTAQHVVTLMESAPEEILLLDLRVATQYAKSHISGSLSLCIPTTLLKRPSFNVQKLAETFKDDEQRARFENWRKSTYIVVYDASSSQTKDAQTSMNTIKKFRAEGYEGTVYIIRGGFSEFSRRFPKYMEDGVDSASSSPAKNGDRSDSPDAIPVIGGCPMPGTDKPANPFFGNIRQNMDLIGGVGQIALQHPETETTAAVQRYPLWLKQAAEDRDQGKKVSNKFEAIERREKKRMEDALSGKVSYGTPGVDAEKAVQIAGLEKGNKNRYNNIWPFEHSRVKLQGVPSYGCDYFNANHIQAAWSNKKYISTQAPIPATFNDFWNVVWQQDVRVIVMLTAEKEGAQVKAHNYWSTRQYGPLNLEFLSEKRASLDLAKIQRHKQRPAAARRTSTLSGVPLATIDSKEQKDGQPYVTVRKFTLAHGGHPFERMREITQLQYSNWPDFGAPAHPAHLLGLVEQCDAVVRVSERTKATEPVPTTSRPVMVHCSAGCGRTGTFCTVDSVIDMLKRQRISQDKQRHTSPMDLDKPAQKGSGGGGGFFPPQANGVDGSDDIEGAWVQREDQDLVEKTVEDFRHQRLSMVQSLRQYVLCYESIMEWLASGNIAA